MVARNSTWVSLLFGGGCLACGVALGALWPEPAATPTLVAPAVVDRAPAATQQRMPSFADVVERIAPGVVSVRAQRALPAAAAAGAAAANGATEPADAGLMAMRAPGSRECSGSGFLVPPNGLVVTCRHIVVDAQTIEVQVPVHGTYRAELVGEDQAADLALLRLLDAPENLPALALAVADDLRAGDWIVAVGNPFGFTQTVTAGIVSFVGRHLPHSDFAVTTDYLQISAPVNPGNSGCPVLDLDGRVVGLMTQAPEQAQGISFAVPSRTVAWAVQTMLRLPDGRVRRGYLGIEFASCSGKEHDGSVRTGAVIVHVVAGQAAHRAGVLEGDVVLEVDGTPVRDAQALHDRIVCTPPGTPIALQVQRKGRVDSRIVAVLGEVASRPAGLPN